MSPESGYSEDEIRNMNQKEFRKEFPSGWMELSRYETLALVIDTLLESDPSREFTPEELANQSGSSKKSVENRIDSLVRLGMITELEDRTPPRYSLNEKSPITQKLYELNLTVQKVKDNELPETISKNNKGNPMSNSENWNSFSEQSGEAIEFKHYQSETSSTRSERGRAIIPGEAAVGAD